MQSASTLFPFVSACHATREFSQPSLTVSKKGVEFLAPSSRPQKVHHCWQISERSTDEGIEAKSAAKKEPCHHRASLPPSVSTKGEPFWRPWKNVEHFRCAHRRRRRSLLLSHSVTRIGGGSTAEQKERRKRRKGGRPENSEQESQGRSGSGRKGGRKGGREGSEASRR